MLYFTVKKIYFFVWFKTENLYANRTLIFLIQEHTKEFKLPGIILLVSDDHNRQL